MRQEMIMLVEDNPDDEALALRALKHCRQEARVVVAHDGPEVLDYLFGIGLHAGRDTSSNPCLILLDLNLPKLSGLDVLKRIRADALTRRIPVIVLTSSREDADLTSCYDMGCNSYIRKPVDYERFVEAIELVGRYWLSLNEFPPRSAGAIRYEAVN